MPTTLKVKNITAPAAAVDIVDASGATLQTINGGATVDVADTVLLTTSFAHHLRDGDLRLVKTDLSTLSSAQKQLGSTLIVRLLRSIGTEMSQADAQATASQGALQKLHTLYNNQWTAAQASAVSLKALKTGTENLVDAGRHFINTKAEDDAVTAAQAAVTAKEAEDLVALGKTLAEWEAEHQLLKDALEVAQARQAAAAADYDTRYKGTFDDLSAVATRADLDESKIVGAAVPAFPLP